MKSLIQEEFIFFMQPLSDYLHLSYLYHNVLKTTLCFYLKPLNSQILIPLVGFSLLSSSFSGRNRDSIHNVASEVFIPHYVGYQGPPISDLVSLPIKSMKLRGLRPLLRHGRLHYSSLWNSPTLYTGAMPSFLKPMNCANSTFR